VGQKTHPKGFRLISTQQHLSSWFSSKKNYSILLQEDYVLRNTIEKNFNNYLTTANIYIDRVYTNKPYIKITLDILYPRYKDTLKKISRYFTDLQFNITKNNIEKINFKITKKKYFENILKSINLSKLEIKDYFILILHHKIRQLIRIFQCKFNKKYFITLNLIKNPFENVILIAKYIAEQLEQRIPFRRVMKETIAKIQRSNIAIKGLKIQISGRLNGNDIARSEWKREKLLPLHTLKAKIDYASETARTIYGLLGIKVWLYMN
jgi:small subunit ribosomal protein S3